MGIFKNISDAETAINKLVPLLVRNINRLEKVEVDNFRQHSNDPDNTYYVDVTFYVDGESFDRELANNFLHIKQRLLDDIKRYMGVTLISNTSRVTTLNSNLN
jgi:hypothetical protein